MSQSFSKRGSAICTVSAEVTEGCHMRFAEYAIRILVLLQDDGTGKDKTTTGSHRHRFATLSLVCCCVATAVPPKQQRTQ